MATARPQAAVRALLVVLVLVGVACAAADASGAHGSPPKNAAAPAAVGAASLAAAARADLQEKQQQPPGPAAASALPAYSSSSSSSTKGSTKPLWPLDATDLGVLAIVVFSLSLAGGAGIGGGAILVPVFLMLRGWPTAVAVALSNITILGGSFANFICNVRRHRPNGKRTIDWELILMMEPTTIIGALVGALLNKLLPTWITTYLLALLLTLMSLRLLQKGRQAYAKESALLAAAKAANKERLRAEQRRSSALSSAAAAGQQHGTATGSTTASRASTPRGIAAGQQRPGRSSGSRDFISRSVSRLRGDLVLSGSLTAASAAAGAGGYSALLDAHQQQRTPLLGASGGVGGGSFSRRRPLGQELRQQSLRSGSAAVAADAAVAAVDDVPAVVAGAYERNTLFQGDVIDDFEPIVVVPLATELSSDSLDLETGAAAHGNGDRAAAYGDDDDGAAASDLHKPLLLQHERAATGDAASRPDQDRSGSAPVDAAVIVAAAAPGNTTAGGKHVPERSLPLPEFLTLVALSAWVVAADIRQGALPCGSPQYWATQLSVLVPVATILLAYRQILLKKYRHGDLPPGTQLPEGELHWTPATTLLYPLTCTLAGCVAGLFGIGGGVVKGPLMLELGVPADVAAATSATMIMFTAGSACIVYSRFGQVLWDYARVLCVLGFVVTLGSQLLTFMLVKLLGRRSIIVFMMVALMSAATAIMYVQSGFVTRDLVAHPEDLWAWGSLCPKEPPHDNSLISLLLSYVWPPAARRE